MHGVVIIGSRVLLGLVIEFPSSVTESTLTDFIVLLRPLVTLYAGLERVRSWARSVLLIGSQMVFATDAVTESGSEGKLRSGGNRFNQYGIWALMLLLLSV